MYDLFYIVETHNHWYNLRLKNTHYCIACGGDLNSILKTIGLYVKKYKTAERVYRMVEGLSESDKMSPATLEQYQEEYGSGRYLVFNDLIHDVVAQAKKEDRENSPLNRIRKIVKTVMDTTPPEKPHEVVVVTPQRKVVPHKIKRTFAAEN